MTLAASSKAAKRRKVVRVTARRARVEAAPAA